MGMTVKRRKDVETKRVIMHRIADIRGGVSVMITEINNRDFLPEGTVISAPDDNSKCHVVKYAKVTANVADNATTIKVAKGHDFKVGDFVMAATGAKAYAISSINTSNASYDTITVGTTLGVAIAADAYIYQAAAESASNTSAFKYAPFAITGTGRKIEEGGNIDVDAWIIAVTKGHTLPAPIASQLKGIYNY